MNHLHPPRVPLHEAIPVPAPWRVYVEPTSRCNIRCKFCPTGVRPPNLPKQGMMEWGLFERIVEQLAEMGPPKFINWYFFGEPLLHPRFCDMVSHAKERLPGTKHWTATNGLLLKGDLARRVADCPLDRICVGIEEVSKQGYKEIAQVNIDYEGLRESLKAFYALRPRAMVYVKTVDHGQSEANKRKFYDDFGQCGDEVDIETLHTQNCVEGNDMLLGAERLPTRDGRTWSEKLVCPAIFYAPAITWDGIVVPCSEDWSRSMAVGDLKTQTLKEVWHGQRMLGLRLSHLRGERMEHSACKNCDLIHWNPDNIDPYREAIAARLTA